MKLLGLLRLPTKLICEGSNDRYCGFPLTFTFSLYSVYIILMIRIFLTSGVKYDYYTNLSSVDTVSYYSYYYNFDFLDFDSSMGMMF